jgi:hypothetical protein
MEPFSLRYQCKTTGSIAMVKRTIDKVYFVLRPGQEVPEKYHGKKLRAEFAFLKNTKSKVNISLGRSTHAKAAPVKDFFFHKSIPTDGGRLFLVDLNGVYWGNFPSKAAAMKAVEEDMKKTITKLNSDCG